VPRVFELHADRVRRSLGRHCVGFTGTASSLNSADKLLILGKLLNVIRIYGDVSSIYVTGGAVGVDTFVAHALHAAGFWVHVVLPVDHDKIDPDWQDWCTSYWQTESNARTRSKRFMDRNALIVASSDVMGAAFPRNEEEMRSGTWATIRRFRGAGKCNDNNIVVLGLHSPRMELERV
jgi:hypothetical protein